MAAPRIYVIIPAFNEEKSIGLVIDEIPKQVITEVIVVNNGSSDDTEGVATKAGATVLNQRKKGYGNACLVGIDHVSQKATSEDIIVFLDGDHSDFPEQLPEVIHPILQEGYDLVIGSRSLGTREKGSMTFSQRFGNALSTMLIKWLYGVNFTDLGPFRAIRFNKLQELNMKDRNYGWTVEMQVKAAKMKLKSCEVPVNYRKRIGVSKVSGTVKGTILAGYKIIGTIMKYSI